MPITIRKLAPEEIAAPRPGHLHPRPHLRQTAHLYASLAGTLLLAECDHTPAGVAAIAYHADHLHIDLFAIAPLPSGTASAQPLKESHPHGKPDAPVPPPSAPKSPAGAPTGAPSILLALSPLLDRNAPETDMLPVELQL